MSTELALAASSSATDGQPLRDLEQALGTQFVVWTRVAAAWQCRDDDDPNEEQTAPENLEELCSQIWKTRQPVLKQLECDRMLIALPWADPGLRVPQVLTGVVESICPQLVEFTLRQATHMLDLREDVYRLREENTAFLRQVTEDFEELTFLRSMAEHLTLEEHSQGLTRLTEYTLSLLGQLVGVEHLYFMENVQETPRWSAAWCDADSTTELLSDWQIEGLTGDLAKLIQGRPFIRNGIQPLELGYDIHSIRELAVIPVTTNISRIGWLVAINRVSDHSKGFEHSDDILSQNEIGSRETSLLSTAAAMLASHANNLSLLEEREELLINVVRALVSAIDSRDPYTCGHSERVALFGRRLAAELGFDEEVCENIYLTGLLHDLGKIGISDSVLKKDGPLTAEEFAEIKRHPDLGWGILQGLAQYNYVLAGVLHHHERYDGKGYPDNLQGVDIPLEGRLLAVVDAFDAMTSDRPYRPGMSVDKAIDILAEGAGTQWDCQMIDAFLRILPDIEDIRNTYQRPPLPTRQQSIHPCWKRRQSQPPLFDHRSRERLWGPRRQHFGRPTNL